MHQTISRVILSRFSRYSTHNSPCWNRGSQTLIQFDHLFRSPSCSIASGTLTTPFQFRVIDQTRFSTSSHSQNQTTSVPTSVAEELSENAYEEIAEETLQALTTYFDDILENSQNIGDSDVSYSSGVLTVKLGPHGTYVINKQTPNKQIWLSSPTSGPKRYDFINKTWIYKHDGMSLYELLNLEISNVLNVSVDFKKNCAFGA